MVNQGLLAYIAERFIPMLDPSFRKHSSPYASCSNAYVSPISFPSLNTKIDRRLLFGANVHFFAVSHTNQHMRGFTDTTVVIIAIHGAAMFCSKDILFPYMPTCFRTLYLILLLSTVHSPQCFVARRGLSTCFNKTCHISLAVSCSELVPRSFDAH